MAGRYKEVLGTDHFVRVLPRLWQPTRTGQLWCGQVHLLPYPRLGTTLTRGYLAFLRVRPQLNIYGADQMLPEGPPLAYALADLALIESHQFHLEFREIVYLVRDGRNALPSVSTIPLERTRLRQTDGDDPLPL